MGFFDDFAYAAENTVKTVGKKVGKIADSSKKAIELAALREKLSREYEKLGRLVAENTVLTATAKVSGDEFTGVFEKIDQLTSEIEKKSRNTIKCCCGKLVSRDVLYCPYCGKKLDNK